MVKTFLTLEETEKLAHKVAESKFQSFKEYVDYEGWADWMNQFTDAPEGTACTESELENIKKAQEKIWNHAERIRRFELK